MDFNFIYNSLYYIRPEIAITVFLALVVLADLMTGNNKKIIPYIALGGIAVTTAFVLEQFSISGFGFTQIDQAANFGMVTVDSFGVYFKVLVLIASACVVFFSFSSDEIKKSFDRIGEYYALIFGMILGMLLMISASDFILIYLSLELMSLSSYVLAGFTKLRDRNSEAALKYLIYGAVSSGIMLFGISLFYGMTGSTNLYVINAMLRSPLVNTYTVAFATILVFSGIGYKISSAPFHFWTPDVYEGAPITITAFLSVASKAAGFALLIRFIRTVFVMNVDKTGEWAMLPVFPWKEMLIAISILTMTLGNFTALWQTNLKRLLAYSSIAHAGYLLLGLAVLSNQGMLAILVYFFIYAFMNLGAFFIVMLIANRIGSEELEDYKGLGYSMPFAGIALALFLVSLIGLPPSAGFIGKLYLFIALVNAKMVVVAVIALLNTVVSLYYYIRILKEMYLSKPAAEAALPEMKMSPLNTALVVVMLIPVIIFGVYFTPLLEFAKSCVSVFGL